MWLSIIASLYSLDILMLHCNGLNINNAPIRVHRPIAKTFFSNVPRHLRPYHSILRNTSIDATTIKEEEHNENPDALTKPDTLSKLEQERDKNLKKKIAILTDQTIHDTEIKMRSIQYLKDGHKFDVHYKVGFLLSMIKKTRDMLNDLFRVAVKNRDDWKALEETKILELIVHTNVDTTNLVKQLTDVHARNPNFTISTTTTADVKKPVDLS